MILCAPEPHPGEQGLVPVGYDRSLPLRIDGTVFLELDDFGRIQGPEVFGRGDVLQELRTHEP